MYTDGSSRGNGQTGARAGYGVYYGDNDSRNTSAPLSGSVQTNQRAELTAINHALRNANNASSSADRNIHIHTDSQYSKKSLTEWGDKWDNNGYRNSAGQPVANQDLVKEGRQLMQDLSDKGGSCEISYVKAHDSSHGNNMADKLANEGAMKN